ncbi:hypothetical protein K7432_000490 [Basidiobolus ranarum]|uniref:Aminopeptidase n=1 Tax=Basidiobolus ranarum TaxID=34480 RepID=A0ABR2WB87_9FUNG
MLLFVIAIGSLPGVLLVAVTPTHYEVVLQPNLDSWECPGFVKINLRVHEKSNKLTFDAKNITLHNAFISMADSEENHATSLQINDEAGTATATFNKVISAKDVVLGINFTSPILSQGGGLKRVEYMDTNGTIHRAAVSQSGREGFRWIVPGWDSPEYKATFNNTVIISRKLMAITNTQVLSENDVPDSDLKQIQFTLTPPMSTYLLTFAMGKFRYLEQNSKQTNKPVRLRLYSVADSVYDGQLALDITDRLIGYYEQMFQLPFPLEKYDQIALPNVASTSLGWGLVIYNEITLLFNLKTWALFDVQSAALNVARVMAHQWLGGLVTPAQWKDLWLSNGFANWYETRAMATVMPEWKSQMNSWFVAGMGGAPGRWQGSIEADRFNDTQPVRSDTAFSGIVNDKSSSVVQMLVHTLGSDAIRTALHQLLSRYKLRNVRTADLVYIISQITGHDVGQLVDAWLNHPGSPIVTVKADNNKLILNQHRYYALNSEAASSKDRTIWQIPITTGNNATAPTIFNTSSQNLQMATKPYYLLNKDAGSPFLIWYPQDNVNAIARAIKHGEADISSDDRVALAYDYLALSESGEYTADQLFEYSLALTNETDPLVMYRLNWLLLRFGRRMTPGVENTEAIRHLIWRIFGHYYSSSNWDFPSNETADQIALRTVRLIGAISSRSPEVKRDSQLRAQRYLAGDTTALNMNLLAFSLWMHVMDSGKETFDQVMKLYLAARDSEMRSLLAIASAAVQEQVASDQFLDMILNGTISASDLVGVMETISINPPTRDRLTKRILQDFHAVESQPQGSQVLNYYISNMYQFVDSQADLDRWDLFFASKPAQYIDSWNNIRKPVLLNIQWLQHNSKIAEKWLREHNFW